MGSIVTALAPILLLILLGYLLKRVRFMSEAAMAGMERLAYFVLFPALLVSTLARQDAAGVPWPAMAGVIVITSLAATSVLVAWHLLRKSVSGETFTSIFQGGVRFNSYIALGVCQAFFSTAGLVVAAVTVAILIVAVNLLSVAAFSVWGRNGTRGFRPFIRDLLVNPLILACVIGWLLGISDIGLPGVIGDLVELIGRAALPVGLLAVGAALQPEAVRGHVGAVLTASVVQFGLKPLTVAALVSAFGLAGVPAGVLFLTFVTPVAPSSYILARQLGGDTAVMASIITLQTLIAFIVMPIVALIVLPTL